MGKKHAPGGYRAEMIGYTGKALAVVVLLLALIKPAPLLAGETRPVEDLSGLIAAALANNPDLKASEARWQSFRSRVDQARSLDDPMLMLKIQNGLVGAPLNFRKDSMTQKVIGISQQLPFWGKRALRGEVAEREAESYQWGLEERKLELARLVKESYYQIYFIDRSLAVVDRNIRIFDDFITLARTRYEVGQGVQQDIFKAQVERSKLLDQRITLEQQRKSQEAGLNTLLNRPTDTPVGPVAEAEIRPLNVSANQLEAVAEENRPLLKGNRALVAKAEAGLRLAKREYLPDFNLAFEYMQRDPAMDNNGADMYSLGVTINLPLRRARRQAAMAGSNAEIRMASEELNGLRNGIRGGIADLLVQMERRRKLAELYNTGIIPQARQSLEAATIGYRVNKVDFLTLLDSRMTLFNYEREYYDSVADYQIRKAQLEALVGKEL